MSAHKAGGRRLTAVITGLDVDQIIPSGVGQPGGSTRYTVSGMTSTVYAPDARKLSAMAAELAELRKRVSALEAERANLVVLREITREQAKHELAEFFRKQSGAAYPSDAAIALKLDAQLVRDLCDELAAEGLLE